MAQWELLGVCIAYFITMTRVTSGQQDPYCDPVADWNLDPCFCEFGVLDCSMATSGDQLLTIPGLQNGESMPFSDIKLMGNDQIEAIPDGAFGNHYAIDTYDFSGNTNLKTIGSNVISQRSTPTLKYIGARICSLVSFPFQDMKNFETLSVIDLTSNNLEEIPAEAFANSNTSLATLIVDGNNISSIGADAFTGLRDFKTLIMYANKLTHLSGDGFKFSSRPDYVVLASNDITRLEEGEYTNFPLVTILADNEIETLEQSPWEGILEQLLGSEGYINMGGNLIVCDCQVEWLYRREEFMPHIQNVFCQNPQGPPTFLWNLEEEFFGSC